MRFGNLKLLNMCGLVAGMLGISFAQASMVDTLPAGINSPSLRYGMISGIDQRYTSESKLYTLSDINSLQFDAKTLSAVSPRAGTLIQTLDRFGSQQLGQNISYGVLRIDTKPQIQYTAPVYARGITDKWTLGTAFPIINYKNKISLQQSNSNLAYYRSQFTGLSSELDAALNLDLAQEAKAALAGLGYKPIEDRNQTYLGDVQLVSAYRFWENKTEGLLYTATANLPTGPAYDADDLLALNSFGRTGVENKITYSRMLNSAWEFAPYVSHNYYFQDHAMMRVPGSESDVLPDQNSKENVQRQLGQTFTVGTETYYNFTEAWSAGIGYSMAEKTTDHFQGDRGRRYDILERDTEAKFQRVNAQIQYSAVKAYFKKQSLFPYVVALNYMDTVAGKNVERRTVSEMTFMMFF